MSRTVALLAGVLAILAIAALGSRLLTTDRSQGTAAVERTPLPWAPPPGYEGTPRPTLTPIAPPVDAAVISHARAEEIGLKVAGPSVTPGSVSTVLRGAAEYGSFFPALTADYPVWELSATGTFVPSRGGPSGKRREFKEISVFIDGITGKIIGLQMRKQLPTGEPTPQPE